MPSYPNSSVTISSINLINEGYIKELNSYIKNENVICSGSVEIFLSNDNYYDYVPNLSCGNLYSSIKLYDKVITDNEYGVVSGSGLYQRIDGKFVTDELDLNSPGISDSFEYVFRGDEVNNYVKIDDNYWRIVSINDFNDMLLIYVGHVQKTYAWDDRYNEHVNKNHGVNIYEQNGIKSRAMESVEAFYNQETPLMNKEQYSSKTKYLISPMNLCVGMRDTKDKDISGKTECSKILENQYTGLLPAYYYMSASLDDSCVSIVSRNCGNYNYLSQFDDYWWLLTANAETTNEAYNVSRKAVSSNLCSAKSNIRPTIMLGSRALYESGIGTKTDPYVVKFFN